MVTIHPNVPNTTGRHPTLQEYEILDLKELFHADSAMYELHCAAVFRNRHYTAYIHNSNIYISDLESNYATENEKATSANFASTLFYHLIPITNDDAQDSEKKDLESKNKPEISLDSTINS